MNDEKLDIGCGPDKVDGCYGIDNYPFPGVDQVFNFDEVPWPLESDSFSLIYARHIIEHVADIPRFINEIHRIGKNGAVVEVVTPHFSSIDSWEDPTHRWHLASTWFKTFTEHYLAAQIGQFKHLSTEVAFSKSFLSFPGRLIKKLTGVRYWEKHFAFLFGGRNITTRLRIVK